MNNEIKRKITSLTLMTIMLAGAMSAAVPSMVPAAHAANANLFVSAENSQFSNYMSGPQVIEVVIMDSDFKSTTATNDISSPVVTINGKKLVMAQAADGNWYAYFADATMAFAADAQTNQTDAGRGKGLDFGQFCANTVTSMTTLTSIATFADTVGVAIPVASNKTNTAGKGGGNSFGINGTTGSAGTLTTVSNLPECTTTMRSAFDNTTLDPGTNNRKMTANSTHILGTATAGGPEATGVANVVREAKSLVTAPTTNKIGQINLLGAGLWPFIQLYNLSDGSDVVIQFTKGGSTQSTTIKFDNVDKFANLSLDASKYPQGGNVHATISDVWLNIDPTDEDSWTFNTGTTTLAYYQLYNENGVAKGESTTKGARSIGMTNANMTSMMCDGNCKLSINTNAQSASVTPLTIVDNAKNIITSTGSSVLSTSAQQPVTVIETTPTSGVFVTYDESNVSNLKIAATAARGTSATIDYSGAQSIIVSNFAGSIALNPTDSEWNSGEKIPIVIVDGDANKNSRMNNDLVVSDGSVTVIPALTTGTPFTLGSSGDLTDAMFTTMSAPANTDGVGKVSVTTGLTFGQNRTATITSGYTVDTFSQRAIFANTTANVPTTRTYDTLIISNVTTMDQIKLSIGNTNTNSSTISAAGASQQTPRLHGLNLLNIDFSSFTSGTVDVYLMNNTITKGPQRIQSATAGLLIQLADNVPSKGISSLNGTSISTNLNQILYGHQSASAPVSFVIRANTAFTEDITNDPIVLDLFSFGYYDDG
ncbi:MAG: hypothetical protein SCG72_06005, partial [Nitrosarchaeum sp.]|nr:hypothetical protein [Nitrosarchaeum sp.]